MLLSQSAITAALPANMPLIYDYLSTAGDTRWYLPPQWYGAQLTNNPGFTTTSPEAVIRKATMLARPTLPPAQRTAHGRRFRRVHARQDRGPPPRT